MTIKDEPYWLQKLATLRIDRARGNPAPHKPLLLLVILEMAEKGEITGCDVTLSPDLAFRFSVFWSVVAGRRRQATAGRALTVSSPWIIRNLAAIDGRRQTFTGQEADNSSQV